MLCDIISYYYSSTLKKMSSEIRRSSRLAAKPCKSFAKGKSRAALISAAFATAESERTPDQHMLVDEVLQNLAKAKYMKEKRDEKIKSITRHIHALHHESQTFPLKLKKMYDALSVVSTNCFNSLGFYSNRNVMNYVAEAYNLLLSSMGYAYNIITSDPTNTSDEYLRGSLVFNTSSSCEMKGYDSLIDLLNYTMMPRLDLMHESLNRFLSANNYPFTLKENNFKFYLVKV